MSTLKNLLFQQKTLLKQLKKDKIVTIDQLMSFLNTNSRMTVFRNLKTMGYISSYSHSGRFYALRSTAKFNNKGLWEFKSVHFSKNGTLKNTLLRLTDESEKGYSCAELNEVLGVKVDDSLLVLLRENTIFRKKESGVFVYYSTNKKSQRSQIQCRSDLKSTLKSTEINEGDLTNELKAALIIFFALLDEKQRRIYSGLESMKIGKGGDKIISDLFKISIKTVSKGRKELLGIDVNMDTVRLKGAGRKSVKKTLQ